MPGAGRFFTSLAVATMGVAPAIASEGAILGTVVNATAHHLPVAGAEVVLRAAIAGRFAQVEQTVTDAKGQFRFDRLPIDERVVYLAGANRSEIHYPGPRIRLTDQQPVATVHLVVCDAVSTPNPLVIRRQEIVVRSQPGGLAVTETLVIANPSLASYVGQPPHPGGEPVTLRLAIPADFQRVTFEKEFFGRRFSLVGDKLVTGIPWPPGERQLQFSYVIPVTRDEHVWQRPLDLPCRQLRLIVDAGRPKNSVVCNLPMVGDPGTMPQVFESRGAVLPAGYVVHLDLGRLPVPLMVYARWTALASLLGVVVAGGLMIRRGRGERGVVGLPHQSAGSNQRRKGAHRSIGR